jgi:hypothetical protein
MTSGPLAGGLKPPEKQVTADGERSSRESFVSCRYMTSRHEEWMLFSVKVVAPLASG